MTELRSEVVAEADHRVDASSEKAKRREARAMVGAYHEEQLRALLEHVREAFNQLDAGEIDEFELDDLIHHYKRAARQLWTFCGSSGGQWLQAATALTYMRDRGEERDWWTESAVAGMRPEPCLDPWDALAAGRGAPGAYRHDLSADHSCARRW